MLDRNCAFLAHITILQSLKRFVEYEVLGKWLDDFLVVCELDPVAKTLEEGFGFDNLCLPGAGPYVIKLDQDEPLDSFEVLPEFLPLFLLYD